MNIVIVNHYAGGKKFGMEFRPYYLAKEWTRMGHNVIIVAASYAHLRSRQPEQLDKPLTKHVVDGINYWWLKTNTYEGNGVSRILSMLIFTFRLFFLKKELTGFKPDLLIASSTYPLDCFPVQRLAKKFKAKFCFEVHDLWPLSPIEFGGYSRFHPFIVIMQWAEDFAYKTADFVVSLLPSAKTYMVSRGMKEEKFVHIPNGVDVTEWFDNPLTDVPEHVSLIDRLRQEGKFLVGFTGSHGIANSLHSLVDAVQYLDRNVAVVFIGDGPEKKPLQQKVEKEKITSVYFLPPVPKSKIPALLQKFDALYVGFQKQSLLRFGISPNKMFDYMMAEKPIIQAVEAGNNLVKEYQCGVDVEPENPLSIANGIIKLQKMSNEERSDLGKNGKKAVLANHDFRILCTQFINAARC